MIDTNDAAFEQAMAAVQQDWERAQVQDGNWVPPKGDYLCQPTDLIGGAARDDKTQAISFWCKPIFTIRGPQMNGQTFFGDRYTTMSPKSLDFLKTFVAHLVGKKNVPAQGKAAIEAAQQAIAAGAPLMNVRIGSRVAKAGQYAGQEFPTVRIVEVYGDAGGGDADVTEAEAVA